MDRVVGRADVQRWRRNFRDVDGEMCYTLEIPHGLSLLAHRDLRARSCGPRQCPGLRRSWCLRPAGRHRGGPPARLAGGRCRRVPGGVVNATLAILSMENYRKARGVTEQVVFATGALTATKRRAVLVRFPTSYHSTAGVRPCVGLVFWSCVC